MMPLGGAAMPPHGGGRDGGFSFKLCGSSVLPVQSTFGVITSATRAAATLQRKPVGARPAKAAVARGSGFRLPASPRKPSSPPGRAPKSVPNSCAAVPVAPPAQSRGPDPPTAEPVGPVPVVVEEVMQAPAEPPAEEEVVQAPAEPLAEEPPPVEMPEELPTLAQVSLEPLEPESAEEDPPAPEVQPEPEPECPLETEPEPESPPPAPEPLPNKRSSAVGPSMGVGGFSKPSDAAPPKVVSSNPRRRAAKPKTEEVGGVVFEDALSTSLGTANGVRVR